jgi:hypothetical protein
MRNALRLLGIALLVASLPAAGQSAPVIDNERVTVWDVILLKGTPGPATPQGMDTVVMFLEGGSIRTVGADGKSSTATRKFGDAVFVPIGMNVTDTLISNGMAHEIVIALKDHPTPVIPNKTGYPAAFPRPGSVEVLANDRVTVWNYTWVPDVATPMHFHDKDIVVAYRYDGALKSVTPDGAIVVNPYKAGDIRFNKGNRTHYEVLTTERQSAVMMELK